MNMVIALHQSLPLIVKLCFDEIEPNFLKASFMCSQANLKKTSFK